VGEETKSIAYQIYSCCIASEGQFLCDTENRTKFLVLQDRTLRLLLSVKEGQTFEPGKHG
jgi:hypothetical protein